MFNKAIRNLGIIIAFLLIGLMSSGIQLYSVDKFLHNSKKPREIGNRAYLKQWLRYLY